MNRTELARLIDHTLLGPTASIGGVQKLCAEAKEYGFMSVCVNPFYAQLASKLLEGSMPKVCVVIGFPHGMSTSVVKGYEAEKAIADGAEELDMVINVAALKAGEYQAVSEDIRAVCTAASKAPKRALVKVILETALLNDNEKRAGAILAKSAGADFVKTSTGFSSGGATVEDVTLLRETVGPNMGVKASGGIHTYEQALAMITAGATRIGASHSVEIIQGAAQ
jgi:deoxyribose-phosphate aldolase